MMPASAQMDQRSNHVTYQWQQQHNSTVGYNIKRNNDNRWPILTSDDTGKLHDQTHKSTELSARTQLHRRFAAFVLITTLATAAVYVGVVCFERETTPGNAFRGSTIIRKPRMLSNSPDQDTSYMNHSSLYLLSRALIPDIRRCQGDSKHCQTTTLCKDTTAQALGCACHQGTYLKGLQCLVCSVCDKTQYVAAPCNAQRDTVCIDVSFPVGLLPMNQSTVPDSGTDVLLTHSSNVFVERPLLMDALETPMYVTNNQQSLDFVWPRLSGLDIAVSVSDVYLVPDYHDVEAVDDTALFHKLLDPSQKMKYYYNHVQNHYCRHPLPDYYSIQLEVIANRTSTAQVVRCDSQDDNLARCPDRHKDGDRYLKWNINSPCPSYKTQKLSHLKGGPNSVVCTDETDLLRSIFRRVRPTTQEYMFPSRECEMHRRQCEQCLNSATCPVASVISNSSLFSEKKCCGIRCYMQPPCQKTFSPLCPAPTVECATGEINIFSLFPHFDSLDRQFACHLKYVPPPYLYTISYIIKIPTINFSTDPQHFTAASSSRMEHERRLSHFDFITALHDTRIKVEDELAIIGDHSELKQRRDSLMRPYTVRELKTPNDLKKGGLPNKSYTSKAVYVQFEKPFLYSSFSWYKDGCYKNISQIYRNQTIYKDDFTPVIARKSHAGVDPSNTLDKPQEITYRLCHRDRAPYIKFFVEKGKSVLQHLQATTAQGKLVASSLYAGVAWDKDTSSWKIIFSATQDECPTIISIKILTKLMTHCAGHFDILITCPLNFTVTFNFSTELSDISDVFVIQINDSATTHNLVLSSIYFSSRVDQANSKGYGDVQKAQPANSVMFGLISIWILIIIIIITTIIALIINCIVFKYINLNVKKDDLFLPKISDGMILEKEENTVNKCDNICVVAPWSNNLIYLFVLLYILYSFVFTFSLGFGIVYFTQSSKWDGISNPDILATSFLVRINKSMEGINTFEEIERTRLYTSFNEKTKACLEHLINENTKQVRNYEILTKKQVNEIVAETGPIHRFMDAIHKKDLSVYLKQINEFVFECNKTVASILERFQAKFYLFMRNTAHNDWLKIPRQIFLEQDGEDPEMRFMSSTQVKQFATWLEVDKADELFAAKENVFGRLSGVQTPEVSSLDTAFPSLNQHPDLELPYFDTSNPTNVYSILGPSFHNSEKIQNSTEKQTRSLQPSTESETFSLSENQQNHQKGNDYFQYNQEKQKTFETDNQKQNRKYGLEFSAKSNKDIHTENIEGGEFDKQSDDLRILDLNLVNDEEEISTSNLINDLESVSEASISDSEYQKIDNRKFYVLIATFLCVDIILWVYRISWLQKEIYHARHGYPDKIPTDEVCKQLLEIQTGCHLTTSEKTSRYFLGGKDHTYIPGSEMDIIFLKDLSVQKSRDKGLINIWNEKMTQKENAARKPVKRCFLTKQYRDITRMLSRIFLSDLVWQGSVTFLAITFTCLCVYYVDNCFSSDHIQSLVGGPYVSSDVQWHVATSDRYLKDLATRLTDQLQRLKNLCDSEVDTLSDLYFRTINFQTAIFTSILQRLCREARGKNCDKLTAGHTAGERIISCNFLPLQVQTIHDVSLSNGEDIVTDDQMPLVAFLHRVLMVSASVVVILLCCRLVCLTTTSTLKHFLLLSGRLPRVQIHQSEKVHLPTTRGNSATMQRSQSWVDSCESGVYLGETEDTNKEDNR